MNLIFLSGGSGTRLWPLSNEVRSKQFLKVFRDENDNHESMVQRMYRMIRIVDPSVSITIATSKKQVEMIRNQLGSDVDISIEPCRKDTFPAIALSVAYLHDVKHVSENDSVVVCPIDPLVEIGYFKVLKELYEIAGESNLSLMGIEPTYPSEKYGYIIQRNGDVEFKEKPSITDAEEYIKLGALWNGGVFAFKLKYLLDKVKQIYGYSGYKELYKNYDKLDPISFDYEIAEKEKSIRVIKYSGEWKDLGTWNTFTEAMHDEVDKNAVLGEGCNNVHVINELSIPIVGLGLKDLIIAATPDGILVSDKHASSFLKKYVPNNRPMIEKKQWGEYKVLDYQVFDDGKKALTKELIILPSKQTSYLCHLYRDEIWNIIKGNGLLFMNGETKEVKAGDTITIEAGTYHAMKAIEELHIINVQIGNDIDEDDFKVINIDLLN